jgi:hypothetical protein
MMWYARARFKTVTLAFVLLSGTSASALEGNTEADSGDKIALRGLVREDTQVSGSPVLISRADIESPLTRVRRVDLVDFVEGEGRIADPAFKAVLLTPLGSTGRPVQPTFSGVGIIDKPDEPQRPEKAPEIPEIKSHPQDANLRLPSPPDSTVKEPTNAVHAKSPALAAGPKQVTKLAASPPSPATTPQRTPAEIGAVRAFTRF